MCVHIHYYIVDWIGPTDKIWGPKQCEAIHWEGKLSLDQCKWSCLETEGCTAIHYGVNGNYPGIWCERRNCLQPVPYPTVTLQNWTGYYISTGIQL